MPTPRKRIKDAGFMVERGSYINTSFDRADRWYLYEEDRDVIDRCVRGYATLAEAADAAEEAAEFTKSQQAIEEEMSAQCAKHEDD